MQSHWRWKGSCADSLDRDRHPTPELMPALPRTPPTLTSYSSRAQRFQIDNLPARYVYSHTFVPCTEFFTLDASTQDSQQETDCDSDMLTDEGSSTVWYTIRHVVLQLTSILKTRTSYWVNLEAMMSLDRTARDFGDYYYLQLVDTVKYILRDILICIIKAQCSDQGERKWKG